MAVVGNTGLAHLALLSISTNSTEYFHVMAIGTGTGQTASSTALKAECTAGSSNDAGLIRSTCATLARITTTVTNDTIKAVNTFTMSTVSSATKVISEVCVASSTTAKSGRILMIGDLSPTASMVATDILKITTKTQMK